MRARTTVGLLIICLAGAGCSSGLKKENDGKAAEVVDGTVASSGSDDRTFGLDDSGGLTSETVGGDSTGGGADDEELLSQRSIYFEYDSDLITAAYRRVIEAHARLLNGRPELQITVEGHADERGSREYNLALGEKRALAVGRMLALLGLPQSRINAISYGEERPYASGNDEAAWRLNRRVDLVY